MTGSPEPAVRLTGLLRRFGDLSAVDGLTLSVDRGELFGLIWTEVNLKTGIVVFERLKLPVFFVGRFGREN